MIVVRTIPTRYSRNQERVWLKHNSGFAFAAVVFKIPTIQRILADEGVGMDNYRSASVWNFFP